MYRKILLGFVCALLVASCGSATSVDLIPPDLRIREAPGQLRPSKNQERVPLYLMVDILNNSSETIELKRLVIRASPSSQSGMKFEPVTQDYTIAIGPSQMRTVDIHIVAWVELPNLDSSSRTIIRATAHFDSDLGGFRRTYNLPILLS